MPQPLFAAQPAIRTFMPAGVLAAALWAGAAGAQMVPSPGPMSADRVPGWEFGGEILWQGGTDIDFDGGSSADLEDGVGLAFNAGYRFNERLEIQLAVEWQEIDYDITWQSTDDPDTRFSGSGELEVATPRVSVNYNFLPGSLTPFVSAGIGWAFIDTNIPEGPPQNTCWWDPWWGLICGSFRDTRDFDEFQYQLGAGVRWDLVRGFSLRLAYEKRWVEFGEATSTPDFDQVRFGIAFRY